MKHMNLWLLLAAALSTGLTLIHIFPGGTDVHAPIQNSPLDPLLKGFSAVVWHGITVMLAINSVALFVAARRPDLCKPLVLMVLAQFLGMAGVFIAYNLVRFGDLWTMPPWIGFAVICAVILIGMRQGQETP